MWNGSIFQNKTNFSENGIALQISLMPGSIEANQGPPHPISASPLNLAAPLDVLVGTRVRGTGICPVTPWWESFRPPGSPKWCVHAASESGDGALCTVWLHLQGTFSRRWIVFSLWEEDSWPYFLLLCFSLYSYPFLAFLGSFSSISLLFFLICILSSFISFSEI